MKVAENRPLRAFYRMLAGVLLLFVLYALWLLAHVFLFDVFLIPTDSMLPTLQPGDRVLVNKTLVGARLYSDLAYTNEVRPLRCTRLKGLRGVRRGDVVVFNMPLHDGRVSFLINHVYAKRCVGLPGDSVSVVDGYLVNSNCPRLLGVEEEQRRLRTTPDSIFSRDIYNVYPYDSHLSWTMKNLGPVYVPRKGDVVELSPRTATCLRHPLEWELGGSLSVDWQHGTVCGPDGNRLRRHVFRHNYYYMCGDNVCDSNDSRYWGLVPEEYIVGVVTRVLYGRDRQTGRFRRGRYFKKVL